MLYSGCTSKAVCRRLMISGILSGCEGLCFPVTASCCLARAITSANVPASLCINSGRMISLLSLTAASCFCSVRSAAAMFLHRNRDGRSHGKVRQNTMTTVSMPTSLCMLHSDLWLDPILAFLRRCQLLLQCPLCCCHVCAIRHS